MALSNAERQRKYRKRNEVRTENVTERNEINWQDIDPSFFDSVGRGVPHKGYVMVTRISPVGAEHDGELVGVVTEADWKVRLKVQCIHKAWGWACKKCLN